MEKYKLSKLIFLMLVVALMPSLISCQGSAELKAVVTMANFSAPYSISISPSSYTATGLKTVAITSQVFTITPMGEIPSTACLSPTLSGSGASAFSIITESCTGAMLTANQSCQVEVQGTPANNQTYSASLEVSCGGKSTSATLNVTGENFLVSSINPADGATAIDPNQSIAITFNYPLNTASIDSASVKLREFVGHYPIPFTYSYDTSSKTLTLNPIRTTFRQHQVEIKLSTSLISASGSVRLSDYVSSSFTTTNARIWGHGLATTSSTPTIYGG